MNTMLLLDPWTNPRQGLRACPCQDGPTTPDGRGFVAFDADKTAPRGAGGPRVERNQGHPAEGVRRDFRDGGLIGSVIAFNSNTWVVVTAA
jgi:hypothetical protein